MSLPILNFCPGCLSVSLFPVFHCLPLLLPSHPSPQPLSNDSAGPKIMAACLVSTSTTLVWCTVSTKLDREAEPSVVFQILKNIH